MNLEKILDKYCKPKYGLDKGAENVRIYNRKDILKAMSEAVKLCNKQNVNGSTSDKYDELKQWLIEKKQSKRLADWDCVHHQEVFDKMNELDNGD